MSDASTRAALLPADVHWLVLRRRVALGGRVLRGKGEADGKGAANESVVRESARGGVVELSAPEVWVETPIRPSGLYVFCDLAPGEYVTGGRDERGFAIEAKRVTIPPLDRRKKPTLLAFDLLVERTGKPAHGGRP